MCVLCVFPRLGLRVAKLLGNTALRNTSTNSESFLRRKSIFPDAISTNGSIVTVLTDSLSFSVLLRSAVPSGTPSTDLTASKVKRLAPSQSRTLNKTNSLPLGNEVSRSTVVPLGMTTPLSAQLDSRAPLITVRCVEQYGQASNNLSAARALQTSLCLLSHARAPS